MFRRLAVMEIAWSDVHVFQADERAAPDKHPDRNLKLIQRELLERIPGESPNLHAMPVVDDDLDAAAEKYSAELESVCGTPPVLDVVHLGLGDDGHTASLVPHDPAMDVRDRWVAATRTYGGYRRMTLTYATLDRARFVVFLVTGADKAAALAGVLAGDSSLPAARLKPLDAVIFADPAAASAISA